MEKSNPLLESPRRGSRLLFASRIVLFVIVATFVAWYRWPSLATIIPIPLPPANTEYEDPFVKEHVPWAQIKPSKSIKWHPCFDGKQCARLEVPLDWSNKSNTRTAAIAIVRLPADVRVTDERHGGPVLLNPGGKNCSLRSCYQDDGQQPDDNAVQYSLLLTMRGAVY